MKKILAILVVMVMCFSFVGFKGDSSPYEAYAAMQQAVADENAFSMGIDGKCKIEVDGTELEIQIKGDMKEIIHSETDVDISGWMTAYSLGEEVKTEMYYNDGYMYIKMDDEKYKMPLDLQNAQAQTTMGGANVGKLEKEMMKSAFVVNTEDGLELSMIADEKSINAIMGDYLTEIMNTVDMEGVSIKLSPIEYKILLADDYTPISQNVSYKLSMTIEDETVSAIYDITTSYRRPTFTSIEFPEDLATYELAE